MMISSRLSTVARLYHGQTVSVLFKGTLSKGRGAKTPKKASHASLVSTVKIFMLTWEVGKKTGRSSEHSVRFGGETKLWQGDGRAAGV